MQNLLQKTRGLNKILQRSAGQPVDFSQVAEVLQEIISSDVFVLSRKGKILGKSVTVSSDLPETDFPQEFNQALLNVNETLVNVAETAVKDAANGIAKSLFEENNTTIVPIMGGGERLGTLLLVRSSKFTDEDLIIAEYGSTVVGMEILRSRVNVVEIESRNRSVVQLALDTLSYSEQEAVEHIFKELNGREGLLVASKIADRVGITRSVIVNALRKFESAGVIESRSLGMKGTFIKILNDQLLPELEKLTNR